MAKNIQKGETAREQGEAPEEKVPELRQIKEQIRAEFATMSWENTGIGSTIFAEKPGDGSAREQAASCQKVLGGWANIAREYATKRYRSNLMNWGMLPFLFTEEQLPFTKGDYLYIPNIQESVKEGRSELTAYVIKDGLVPFTLRLGEMTQDERTILLQGCLINYYKLYI